MQVRTSVVILLPSLDKHSIDVISERARTRPRAKSPCPPPLQPASPRPSAMTRWRGASPPLPSPAPSPLPPVLNPPPQRTPERWRESPRWLDARGPVRRQGHRRSMPGLPIDARRLPCNLALETRWGSCSCGVGGRGGGRARGRASWGTFFRLYHS